MSSYRKEHIKIKEEPFNEKEMIEILSYSSRIANKNIPRIVKIKKLNGRYLLMNWNNRWIKTFNTIKQAMKYSEKTELIDIA